ncbi:MAG: DUF374 domain-containing protein [Pseudomonadota bacterium]
MTKPDSSIDARRGKASRRRMTLGRRVAYAVGLPLLRLTLRLLWMSYRVKPIDLPASVNTMIDNNTLFAPCYWHQNHILCTSTIKQWIRRGFRAAFLISGSVDGEVPARIAAAWGAEVIRGSSNTSGALVLRDMHAAMREGVSIVTTADGPLGPQHHFKEGAVLMARIGGAPLVALGCAADRAWVLERRWDQFIIPKPFARVAICVSEPIDVPKSVPADQLETYRARMEQAVNEQTARARAALALTASDTTPGD